MSARDRPFGGGDGDSGPSGPPVADIVAGDLYHLLSPSRRRATVLALEDGPLPRQDLENLIAADEFGPRFSNKERQRVRVPLYQHHLPALQRHGVIEWVRNGMGGDIVRPGPEFGAVLATIKEVDRRTTSNAAEVPADA